MSTSKLDTWRVQANYLVSPIETGPSHPPGNHGSLVGKVVFRDEGSRFFLRGLIWD